MTSAHDARSRIADVIRGRVLRGIHSGALHPGDRLPTSREVAGEFEVDYRLAIDAYKELQDEGLVELRPRGGVYIALRQQGRIGIPPLPERWIVELFAAALMREIPAPELAGWLERCVGTLRLRAGVVAASEEQAQALCRELQDDFGLDASPRANEPITGSKAVSAQREDLIVATNVSDAWAQAATDAGMKVIRISIQPELLGNEWSLLLRRPLFIVVESATVADTLRAFYQQLPGIDNLRIIVFGHDELSSIPEGAPTYLTKRVKAQLGSTRIPGRILPMGRMIPSECARELLDFIVRANIDAMMHIGR